MYSKGKRKITQGMLLLMVIYIAFISLGLPDTVLGVAWPKMRTSFGLPLEAAGIIIMVTTLCTAVSSIISGHIIVRLGTGRIVFISCVLTGSMLVGYSLVPSYVWLLILAIPLGFGAGAVDSGLNNYVAKNYTSRQMSWLHCFWGVGAAIGPYIMTAAIARADGWRSGYRLLGIIQLSLSAILLISLPLWKAGAARNELNKQKIGGREKVLRSKAVWLSITAFPLYIGIESGLGVWLGSYLIEGRDISQNTAGFWVSLYYLSITVGRFITGLLTKWLNNKQMIRGGLLLCLIGAALYALPSEFPILTGIILIGLGCSPVFPCMMHETPRRFEGSRTEIITGFQVGMAYIGGVVIIPLIGLLAGLISLAIIPFCVIAFAALTLAATEYLNLLT